MIWPTLMMKNPLVLKTVVQTKSKKTHGQMDGVDGNKMEKN